MRKLVMSSVAGLALVFGINAANAQNVNLTSVHINGTCGVGQNPIPLGNVTPAHVIGGLAKINVLPPTLTGMFVEAGVNANIIAMSGADEASTHPVFGFTGLVFNGGNYGTGGVVVPAHATMTLEVDCGPGGTPYAVDVAYAWETP